MSSKYYDICCNGIGRAVEIRTTDGRFYRGVIERVSSNKVYLQTLGSSDRNGGYGYDGYGYSRGFHSGSGFVAGIALGLIASLIFIPFFW
ncbi:hypothetical protein ACFSO7_12640 [Bacillus sp. CGMCC 1.16607]|uniref:hypothetical protein n=1 Tax=Bacillus sp. CGMCC 1.16607 TaxID=3351842 RepID=UPI003641935A